MADCGGAGLNRIAGFDVGIALGIYFWLAKQRVVVDYQPPAQRDQFARVGQRQRVDLGADRVTGLGAAIQTAGDVGEAVPLLTRQIDAIGEIARLIVEYAQKGIDFLTNQCRDRRALRLGKLTAAFIGCD